MDDEILTLAIDNGSGIIKAGFAGDDAPKIVEPNIAEIIQKDDAVDARGVKTIRNKQKTSPMRPIQNGVITDTDCMEKIWQYIFTELSLDSSESPVLLTDHPHNPAHNREKAAQILFEKFNSPSLYIATDSLCTMYSTGKITGIVISSGYGVTHVSAVLDGFPIPFATRRWDYGGGELTKYLADLLNQKGCSFHTTRGLDIVNEIKEKCCYVASDYESESNDEAKDIKEMYTLPDNTVIEIDHERFSCPEVLFNPSLAGLSKMGIHEMVYDCIKTCDVHTRKDLATLMFLCGGSTLFPGFKKRLKSELSVLLSLDKMNVIAPPERKYSVWIGASILGSSCTFYKNLAITKKCYDEEGPRILNKRF